MSPQVSARGDANCRRLDTSILIAGALTAAAYFDRSTDDEREVRSLADSLYRRVDWRWAQNGQVTVSHGWKPAAGFLRFSLAGVNEALILYVLGLGSPSHCRPELSYKAWTSTYRWKRLYGHEFLYGAALFMRINSPTCGLTFAASRTPSCADTRLTTLRTVVGRTYVNQESNVRNPKGFRDYGPHTWGITASNGPGPLTRRVRGVTRRFLGYTARGVPYGPDDGTLAPWAVVASLPFAPDMVLPTLEHCSKAYPKMENEYGLVCSFNPTFPSGRTGRSGWNLEGSLCARSGARRSDDRELLFRADLAADAELFYIIEGLLRADFSGGWSTSRTNLNPPVQTSLLEHV